MFRITTGTTHHIDLFYTELAFRLVEFLLKVKAALLKLQGKNLNGYTCLFIVIIFVCPPTRHDAARKALEELRREIPNDEDKRQSMH